MLLTILGEFIRYFEPESLSRVHLTLDNSLTSATYHHAVMMSPCTVHRVLIFGFIFYLEFLLSYGHLSEELNVMMINSQ